VLVVVEVLLVPGLLPAVDGGLVLMLPVLLYPLVDKGGTSDELEYVESCLAAAAASGVVLL
jgi:hypothetical protein